MNVHGFSEKLLDWFDRHGRKNLPWQRQPRSMYATWVSEIMLQQTQVSTVIPYYERFMRRFPDVTTLAAASLDEVLHHWSGLGYYARGRNLHKAARLIVDNHGGRLPDTFDAWLELPGIGRSTAGAVLAQAAGQRHAILDGNVKRVLARYFAVDGWPGEQAVATQLWQHAEDMTPHTRVAEYTQAIMDLGALVCLRSKPLCGACPLGGECVAHRQGNTGAYPGRRPKCELPQRAVQMIVLQDSNGRLLLQRRPPAGLWGGLLSFPELAVDENAIDWCSNVVGCVSDGPANELAPLVHTFSHFRLHITPRCLQLTAPLAAVREDQGWVWFTPGESIAGLAAPVSKLIEQLQQSASEPELALAG